MINFIEKGNGRTGYLYIENLAGNTDAGCRRALAKGGQILRKTASDSILKTAKTGRYYKYRGRRKRASSAGQPPANRTGTNRKSIGFQVQGTRKLRFGAGASYSGYLERGTSKMQARPFLKPAIKKEQKTLYDTIENGIGSELGA